MTGKPLKISVVICAYTMERFNDTCEAILSLQEQTLPPYEIIIAVDHDEELFEKLRNALPENIRIIRNEGAPGVSVTRNTGILATTGDIIACMDDDARAHKDWLEIIVKPFEKGNVSIVGGKSELFWKGGERPVWFAEELDWIVGGTYKGHPETPAEVRNISSCSMALLRETLEAAGYFDERIGSVNGERRGGEEAVFCLNIKNALPDKLIWYEPGAVVLHKVHIKRATIGYIIRRSYQEGVSKALLERLVKSNGSLAVESSYLKYLIKKSIPERLATVYKKASFLQLGAISFSVLSTLAGYSTEKTRMLFRHSGKRDHVVVEG